MILAIFLVGIVTDFTVAGDSDPFEPMFAGSPPLSAQFQNYKEIGAFDTLSFGRTSIRFYGKGPSNDTVAVADVDGNELMWIWRYDTGDTTSAGAKIFNESITLRSFNLMLFTDTAGFGEYPKGTILSVNDTLKRVTANDTLEYIKTSSMQ